MSTPVRARPAHPDVEGPWTILPIADMLVERKWSTTTRLGMPLAVRAIDDLPFGAAWGTGSAAGRIAQFWRVDVSSTETGMTYPRTPCSVREETPKPSKRPLHQNALNAYLRGELRPFGRAATIRPELAYEQDLDRADRLMRDEPVRRSRKGYR